MYRGVSVLYLSIAMFLGVWCGTQYTALAQDRVRAKVGIQVRSGEHTAPAKTSETVKAGDFLRVYVVPEDEAYVYVVHNDGTTSTLLNAPDTNTKMRKGSLLALPSPERFYQVDGASARESITIICSPTELRAVTGLFSTSSVPQRTWVALEQELLAKSKIALGQKADKPFQIAGTVRSLHADPFLEKLQMFSGHTMVVKKYDFHVQK